MVQWWNPSTWFGNVSYSRRGKDHVYMLTDGADYISAFNGGYTEANMMTMFELVPEFFEVVDAVASRVKNGEYYLCDADGNPVDNNDLWNNMVENGANWQYSLKDLIYHAVVHKYVTGNRYGYANIPSTLPLKHKNIKTIQLLSPQYVTIRLRNPRPSILTTVSAKDYIESYQYNAEGQIMTIHPDYVLHRIDIRQGTARDFATGKGTSRFISCDFPLSNLVSVYKARGVIYTKRGPGGMIVSAKTDVSGMVALTPKEKKEIVDDLHQNYGVDVDKSPFMVSNQPLNWIKTGSTIAELEPFKELTASKAALAGVARVPTPLITRLEDSKYTNLDIAERNFHDNVVQEEAEEVCRFLTKLCRFNELGLKVDVSFDDVKALQDDKEKQAQAYATTANASIQLYNGGHITRNELREDIGKETITGGDEYADPQDNNQQDNNQQNNEENVNSEA